MMRSQGVDQSIWQTGKKPLTERPSNGSDVTASNGVSQTYYFALQDKYYFCAILTYTSNSSKEELFEAWQSSRFDR